MSRWVCDYGERIFGWTPRRMTEMLLGEVC
jgi:hypothetical protein